MKLVSLHSGFLKVFLPLAGLTMLLAAASCGVSTPVTTPAPAASEEPTATQVMPTDMPPTESPTEGTDNPAGGVSFSQDVLPILEANCTRCHGTSRQSGGLKLNTFDNVMVGGEDGAVVLPGDPANSLLVQVIVGGSMPKNAAKLSDTDIQTITDWVNAGAPEN